MLPGCDMFSACGSCHFDLSTREQARVHQHEMQLGRHRAPVLHPQQHSLRNQRAVSPSLVRASYLTTGSHTIYVPHYYYKNPSSSLHVPLSPVLAPAIAPNRRSNKTSLEAALDAAVKILNHTVKPVLVGGPKLRLGKAKEAFQELVEASGYAYATMPSAKGQPLESHPHIIGTYWGAVSSPFCLEIVESADAYIFVGKIFNAYSSVGYSSFLKKDHMIVVNPDRVQICGKAEFGCVLMKDFCMELSKRITRNSTSFDNYKRIHVPKGTIPSCGAQDPLRVNVHLKHIQVAFLLLFGEDWLGD
nr:pyruvate decarboxylase 1-like [Physcomitrium patens]|eukprot:XP_024370344.1 pyruvate decarboxylase 1-like [Physcomitrella patens]